MQYAILTQDVYMPRAAFQAASHAVQQQHAAHMHVSDDDISDDITEEAEEELDPAVQVSMHACCTCGHE